MVRWWKMKNEKLNGIFNSFPLSESGGFCLFSLTFGLIWRLNITQLIIALLQVQAQAHRPQNDKPYYYHSSGKYKNVGVLDKKEGIIRKLEAARRTGGEILGYPFSSFSTISTNNCICHPIKRSLLCWECAAACSVAHRGRRWFEPRCSPLDALLLVARPPPWKCPA